MYCVLRKVFKCEKRHPKTCSFKRDYGYCKFKEYCRFNHSKPKNIIAIDEKILVIEKEVKNLQSCTKPNSYIDKLEEKINAMGQSMEKKIETFENKMDNQRKDLEEKNAKISELEIRLDEVEKKQKNEKLARERKIKDLESTIKGMNTKKKEACETFQCSECGFESKSRNGLKTHKARMHTTTKY